MLSTVGRGGDGQAIRDEILNIMHRNRIPEKKGTWMEEWHQKLHNNTTPDDVPICDAYLAFLREHGNNGAYWRVLSDAGITRERLESFDRPIRCEPEYFGHCRDQLIRDFENYSGILKAVHSGADLQNASKNAGGQVSGAAKGHLGYVLASQGSNQVCVIPINVFCYGCSTTATTVLCLFTLKFDIRVETGFLLFLVMCSCSVRVPFSCTVCLVHTTTDHEQYVVDSFQW
jgi:hypothetical protein